MDDYSGQERLVKDAQVVGAVGGQWGDEGKGKIVDWLAAICDVVMRATGGNNAGHTIKIGDEQRIFHLVPSGAMHPDKTTIIGNGVVDDLMVHLHELAQLHEAGVGTKKHYVSGNAHVILPQHKLADLLIEVAKGADNVGTTGRGIGPAYASKANRTGLRINDLFAPDLEEKIASDIALWMPLFRDVSERHPHTVDIKALLHADNQMDGRFWSGSDMLDVKSIAEAYRKLGEAIKPYVTDTVELVNKLVAEGKRVLLEGAQGAMLDFDQGTYPFVTSSNPTKGGLYSGTGINRIDLVFSIMKAYVTRVGGGPHVTELADYGPLKKAVAEYREEHGKDAQIKLTEQEEQLLYEGKADDQLQGKAMMVWGGEYGATTGRPRRCGWFDAVQARRTAMLNGPKVIITKLDVLSDFPELKACKGYVYEGPERHYNDKTLTSGTELTDFPTDAGILEHCRPVYGEKMAGWMKDISGMRSKEELPRIATSYVEKLEQLSGIEVAAISNGPERSQMIVK